MKRNSFPLVVLSLICGMLIGYYVGSHSKIKEQSEEASVTNFQSSNLPIYNGPFGLDMGLSLDDVKQVCKVKHLENDAYEVIPPKKNDLFETYIVWIDSEYGVHGIRAISEQIITNDHGTELKSRFENIVRSIENKYGRYKKVDSNSNRIFGEAQYFMYTLREGSRELAAIWAKKHLSQLPDNIAGISVEVVPENVFSDAGYVILEYGFSNSETVKAKADSVF